MLALYRSKIITLGVPLFLSPSVLPRELGKQLERLSAKPKVSSIELIFEIENVFARIQFLKIIYVIATV